MAGKLTALAVERETRPGKYADGDGLYLVIAGKGKSWQFRYWVAGKERWHGLGSLKDVSLKQAREKRDIARQVIRSGVDPVQKKREERSADAQVKAVAALPTFRDAAESYIKANRASWKSPKHRAQWPASLEAYAYPFIGDKRIDEIQPSHILELLRPIWIEKRETANRVRSRIEIILASVAPLDAISYRNPAELTLTLKMALPRRPKRDVRAQPALPYRELPAFMARLQASGGVAARALEFLILTACRTNEAIHAVWPEIDLRDRTWRIPADRMKAGKDHIVALSSSAAQLLIEMQKLDHRGIVFPNARFGSLSNGAMLAVLKRLGYDHVTCHGFRSTFRDWAAEKGYPDAVAEAALAHTVSDAVVAAYRRTQFLEQRFEMMEAWAGFCLSRIARAAA